MSHVETYYLVFQWHPNRSGWTLAPWFLHAHRGSTNGIRTLDLENIGTGMSFSSVHPSGFSRLSRVGLHFKKRFPVLVSLQKCPPDLQHGLRCCLGPLHGGTCPEHQVTEPLTLKHLWGRCFRVSQPLLPDMLSFYSWFKAHDHRWGLKNRWTSFFFTSVNCYSDLDLGSLLGQRTSD